MVDAAAKLNLEANYEKTFSITSQRFAAAKYFVLGGRAIIRFIYERETFIYKFQKKKAIQQNNFYYEIVN